MSEDRIRELRQSYADDYRGDEPPDLGLLRALAEREELADAVSRLADGYGRQLPAHDPLTPLAREVARALTEAGFTLHHCAQTIRCTGSAGYACCRSRSAMIPAAGEDRGLVDHARPDVARLGSVVGVPRRERGHERRTRRSARRTRLPDVVVWARRRVDRDRPQARLPGQRSVSGADRAIRVSTAVAVLGVAGIAAYVSYWHAYEVVRAHGESGVTARLEPATIDGLVYASSMVVLYAARHRLAVPALARWLLALGIVATLAANVAHGWPDGPIGAAVAAWPAVSLVGSYELLLWLVRTAAAGAVASEPTADLSLGACWAAGPGRSGAHRTRRVSGNEAVGWSMVEWGRRDR